MLIQDSDTGRLALVDSCTIQDIPQICVDNEDRTYCALVRANSPFFKALFIVILLQVFFLSRA